MHYRQLPSGFRDFNVGLIICLHTFCQCTGSKGSDEAAPMLRRIWAFTERICHLYAHFVQGRRAVTALARLNANWTQTEHWLIKYGIYTPVFLCMCERGSDKSACMLRLFWEFTEYGHMAICTPILYMFESSECAGETASMLRLVWEYTKRKPICLSILCICESSEGSGGTAHIRMRVWAFTGRICHMYANIVHVREQWRNWQDCMHATSSLSIG